MMPVAIICGGKGTRLGELTEGKPKSLVEVAGRPFIEWQIELLHKSGYKDIVLCLGHLWEQLYVKEYPVRYSFEEEPLGTGGAVKNAISLLGGEFMTIYGDSYLDCPYAAIEDSFHLNNNPALTTRYRSIIDYGLGMFRAEAFDDFSGNFSLTEVYDRMAFDSRLSIFHIWERYYEIGSPKGLEETCRHLQQTTSKG